MFVSPYTTSSQHNPYPSIMGPSYYSTPYYLGHLHPSSYETSPSHIPPTSLPDLDYELETSPSTSSAEIIPTPPSSQMPLPFPDFTLPAYPRTRTCQPNTEIYYEMGEGSRFPMLHSANQQEPPPDEVLDFPLTTCFLSPLGISWVPNHTASPVPPLQSPLELHQPRPSRRIPIVNLNELASACDTAQGGDHTGSEGYSPCVPYQWPAQVSARTDSNTRTACGAGPNVPLWVHGNLSTPIG